MRAPITTHILDLHSGKPAEGVKVELISPANDIIASSTTNADGRILQWPIEFETITGTWHLRFFTQAWFQDRGEEAFFSDVTLSFNVGGSEPHYHVPLLLNACGFSTYRGS